MAISQHIKNQDRLFDEARKVVVINDLDPNEAETVNDINQTLYTDYHNEVISTVPSCACGKITTRIKLGKVCDSCGDECQYPDDITPIIWLKVLGTNKFINPAFWQMVTRLLDKNTDCLRWLSDPNYNPKKKPDFLSGCLSIIGNARSYTNLITNFKKLLLYMKQIPKIKKEPSIVNNVDLLIFMWDNYKDDILSDYLSIPNKSIFVMESTSKGRFVNLVVSDVVNIVNEWLIVSSEDLTNTKKDRYTAKAISSLSTLSVKLFKDYVVSKPGIFRKHQYGARSPFTFRCTITCIPREHLYNVIEIPWAIGCSAYRPYVLNKLEKRGYRFEEAIKLVNTAVDKYDPVIAEILKELVDESPYELGLPVNMHRNPTLLQGSAQLVYAVFKDDPEDHTVSVSKLIINAPNGDYDGDALNFTIFNDKLMADEFSVYAPHYNVPDVKSVYSISGALSMQGPANTIMTGFLKQNDGIDTSKDIDKDQDLWDEMED